MYDKFIVQQFFFSQNLHGKSTIFPARKRNAAPSVAHQKKRTIFSVRPLKPREVTRAEFHRSKICSKIRDRENFYNYKIDKMTNMRANCLHCAPVRPTLLRMEVRTRVVWR